MTVAHAHALTGWSWLLPALVVLAPFGLYVAGVRRRARTWSRWRTASFFAGLVLVGLALTPPLTSLAHSDPRAHMAQHLLLGMYASVALVLAAPVTLLLGALGPRGRRVVSALLSSTTVHVLSHPVTAGLLSTGGLFLLYLGPAHQLLDHPWGHHLVNLHLLLAGCLFAWSVAGPDPAPRRPGFGTRLAVLVLAAGAHAWLAKLLYAGAASLPALSRYPVDQSEQATQLMYYGGDGAEVLLAVALFAGWHRGRAVARRRRVVAVPDQAVHASWGSAAHAGRLPD